MTPHTTTTTDLCPLQGAIPFGGEHSHLHDDLGDIADRGLFGIVWFAFLLGFAHDAESEIIGLCAGSTHCLELVGVYAITGITGIIELSMLLIAGYGHYEEQFKQYTPYLPAFSLVLLLITGAGFIIGVF